MSKSKLYTYDNLNRKETIQVVTKDGKHTRKSVYEYFENGYKVTNMRDKKQVEMSQKIIQFKDGRGNIVKEYNMNLSTKKVIIIEKKIEYIKDKE